MPDSCLTPAKTQLACDQILAFGDSPAGNVLEYQLLWDLVHTAANGFDISEQARLVEQLMSGKVLA